MWAMAGQAAIRALGLGGRARGGGIVAGPAVRSRKPEVQRLSAEKLPILVPWSGCGARLMKEVGDLEACTARVAVSLVACALAYDSSIEIACIAGFYWAWAPICATALPNLLLRLRYGYAGIWSAQVIRAEVVNEQKYVQDERDSMLAKFLNKVPKIPPTLRLEIGDGSAATFTPAACAMHELK